MEMNKNWGQRFKETSVLFQILKRYIVVWWDNLAYKGLIMNKFDLITDTPMVEGENQTLEVVSWLLDTHHGVRMSTNMYTHIIHKNVKKYFQNFPKVRSG